MQFAQQGKQGVTLAERALANGRPFALAFIDMRMPPGWDGLETIEHLWAADPDVQVVICSAHSDYDWADFIERLGHTDKLLVLKKPFEPIEVLQCASALTRKWQDRAGGAAPGQSLEHMVAVRTMGLEAANHQLRHLATHDALTGLPNRVLLDDRLDQAIAHAERDAQQFAVLVLDLDRFKFINDSLGHRAGDELLNEVAQRLRGVVSNIDTVARIGGDEFVLVLGSASRTRGRRERRAARDRGVEGPVTDLPASTCTSPPSIGIAFYPADGTSAGEPASRTPTPRCTAPSSAAATTCSSSSRAWTPPRASASSSKATCTTALAQEQFELHYQPKVDTATDDFHSAEALIRWHHPERGMIMPDDFIPLAEECGLINAIGEWVLREACRQCKAWQREGLPPHARRGQRLGIAVPPGQPARRHSPAPSTTPGLDPRCLELELTESAVMTNPEESARILEKLSDMGVLVSVDDFGTGYSSMSYLRRFPIDKLKIDRGFVKDLMTRADDASIVQAIISLAHSLRLKVVAEGVETPEQLDS